MTLRVCLDCSTAFAVGARWCPHCGSERHAEQGSAAALGIQASVPVGMEDDMPKITRHGGASIAGETPAPVKDAEQPPAAPEPETLVEETPAPKKTAARRKARPVKDTSEQGVE